MGNEINYDRDGQLYIRKSMIEDYYFCPYKFYDSWIAGNKPTRSQYQSILDMGTRFHEFAYKFFDYYEGLEFHQWEEFIPYGWFNEEEVKRCQWFIEQEQLRFVQCDDELFKPIAREIRLVDEELRLSSVCDRIDWFDNSSVTIVEYKTSKSFDDKSLVRQMSFYAYIWQKCYGYDVANLKVINPRLKEIRVYKYHSDYAFNVLEDIYELRTAIAHDNYLRKCNPIKHIICGVCDAYECGCYDNEDVELLEHRGDDVL